MDTKKANIASFFFCVCVYIKSHVSCNYSCQDFSQSKIVESSVLSPIEKKMLLAAQSLLIYCSIVSSALTLCHVLEASAGFPAATGIILCQSSWQGPSLVGLRLKAIITWHKTWGTEITECSCGSERKMMLEVQ